MGKLELQISLFNHNLIIPNNKQFVLTLSSKDSVYSKKTFTYPIDHEWVLDSIIDGEYVLSVEIDSTIIAKYNKIIVTKNKVNNYYFAVESNTHDLFKSDSDSISNKEKVELTMNVLYGNNDFYETNRYQKNEMLSGEFSFNMYKAVLKHYSLGIKYGYQYANTKFYNDTTHYLGKQTLSKHYSSNIINIGFVNRFTFFNNQKIHNDGLKLDIGIMYNFPLSFKEITRVTEKTTQIARHIHRYNDFSAIVRLGYKNIGLQAEYNITNFLLMKYTEIPTLRVGLVFFIPNIAMN
jgi:hypothetical protein